MGVDLASTDAPFGLQPYGPVLHASMYAIVTAYGTAIYTGDLVESGGSALTTAKYGTIQRCQVEDDGPDLLGAVISLYDSDGVPTNYIAASTTGDGVVAGYALVADHPDQEYLVQEDGVTSSIQVADIGLNLDCISTHSGSTTTGQSAMELDSDTINTTATLGFKLIAVHPDDTISAAGAAGNHARFIVKMNAAHRGNNVAGA